MSDIYARIRKRRQELGLTMDELAARMGYKDRSSISKIEHGRADIPQAKVVAFAKALNTTTAYLMGLDEAKERRIDLSAYGFEPVPPMSRLPIVGSIACGEPILAEQNIEGYATVPEDWRATFILRCKGDSMAPVILEGDIVAIRKQDTVDNGQIAAVRIGDEATLKRVFLHDDYIELRPENSAYRSIIRKHDDLSDIHIEGIAVGFCRSL